MVQQHRIYCIARAHLKRWLFTQDRPATEQGSHIHTNGSSGLLQMFIDKLQLHLGPAESFWCGTAVLAPPSRRHDRVASASEKPQHRFEPSKGSKREFGASAHNLVTGSPPATARCSLKLPSEDQSSWPTAAACLCSVAGCKRQGMPLGAGSMTLTPPPPQASIPTSPAPRLIK